MMLAVQKITAGRIRYQLNLVPNPAYRAEERGLFSEELQARIRRHNLPEWRLVYFDGRHSRREEINVDYGVRSLSLQLRSSGRAETIYCKKFRTFGFCIEYPAKLPAEGPLPDLKLIDETATIAGLRCRKGEYKGARHLMVWYTEEVEVEDPTGAVLQLEGVPGLILQTEEVPLIDSIDEMQRVTVSELSFDEPPPEIFWVPAGYRRFSGIDAARAEERRILDRNSAEELELHPLDAFEREMFLGKWLFNSSEDKILVEIGRTADEDFRFRTTVLTAPEDAPGRVCNERASMKARSLLVEDPPNYRLYKLGDGSRTLIDADNELFTFIRI